MDSMDSKEQRKVIDRILRRYSSNEMDFRTLPPAAQRYVAELCPQFEAPERDEGGTP